MPTVFSAVLEPFKVIRGGKDRFIIRIVHVRDQLFLLESADNTIELMNFSTDPPTLISSFEIQNVDGVVVDLDFYKDESFVIAGFRGDLAVVIDMRS